jgi:hypothetical protein
MAVPLQAGDTLSFVPLMRPGRPVVRQEISGVASKSAIENRGTHLTHQREQKMQVMQAEQLVCQYFRGFDQVADIGA